MTTFYQETLDQITQLCAKPSACEAIRVNGHTLEELTGPFAECTALEAELASFLGHTLHLLQMKDSKSELQPIEVGRYQDGGGAVFKIVSIENLHGADLCIWFYERDALHVFSWSAGMMRRKLFEWGAVRINDDTTKGGV